MIQPGDLQQEVEVITWRKNGEQDQKVGCGLERCIMYPLSSLPYSGLLFDASRIF